MRLDAPERGRLRARRRRLVATEDLEHLADETLGRPVGKPDTAAGATYACKLGSRSRVVGREHHAERRKNDVEARLRIRKRFGIGDLELDVETLGAGAVGAALEKTGHVIGRRHAGSAACSGERRIAVAGGDIEYVFVPAHVTGFGELL